MTEATRRGGCACGRIRYQCSAEPIYQLICHCRDCQRASGSGYAAAIFVPNDALILTGEQPKFHVVKADSGRTMHRGFCGACGSPVLVRKPDNPRIAILHAASLDDPSQFAPTLEIYCGRSQAWAHPGDTIVRVEGGPPPDALVPAIEAYFARRT